MTLHYVGPDQPARERRLEDQGSLQGIVRYDPALAADELLPGHDQDEGDVHAENDGGDAAELSHESR